MEVVSDGKAVLKDGKLDEKQFFAKAWGMIEPEVEAALREEGPMNGDAAPSDRGESLDRTFVRQKITSLGESGSTFLASLKLS